MHHSPSEVASNKYLQIGSNGQHFLYSIKHKEKISVDGILVLVSALVSFYDNHCLSFSVEMQNIFHYRRCKNKKLAR